MGATTLILAVISPLVVSLVHDGLGHKKAIELIVALLTITLYTIGAWLDGFLAWPLTQDYYVGLFAAFGIQQTSYGFLKRKPGLLLKRKLAKGTADEPATDTEVS